jgi:DNA-nicking Smr family endonuclease
MDFGDILEKWEKQKGSISHNKSDSMEALLRENDIYDKDAAAEPAERDSALSRRHLRAKKADASLDIHGLTRQEAWTALEHFFEDSKAADMKKILVIHGKGLHSKGDAVLGRTVRDFIERCPFAGESGSEKGASGGSGATWVLLKGR